MRMKNDTRYRYSETNCGGGVDTAIWWDTIARQSPIAAKLVKLELKFNVTPTLASESRSGHIDRSIPAAASSALFSSEP